MWDARWQDGLDIGVVRNSIPQKKKECVHTAPSACMRGKPSHSTFRTVRFFYSYFFFQDCTVGHQQTATTQISEATAPTPCATALPVGLAQQHKPNKTRSWEDLEAEPLLKYRACKGSQACENSV